MVKALQENQNNVKAIISSSAIGWYGPDPAIPNPILLQKMILLMMISWDKLAKNGSRALNQLVRLSKRLVKLRTGIVLSNDGGALAEFKKPLRFGTTTILGNGKQVISWIHIDDLVRLYISAIENENMNGIYNAVAPHPVSNKELILQLATISRGKFFIPLYVPSFILKLVMGELSIEVLKSATVSAAKVQYAGFTFLYPSIEAGLKALK